MYQSCLGYDIVIKNFKSRCLDTKSGRRLDHLPPSIPDCTTKMHRMRPSGTNWGDDRHPSTMDYGSRRMHRMMIVG